MTECPRCGAAVPIGSTECPQCGVVFAKFGRRVTAAAPDPQAPPTPDLTPPGLADQGVGGLAWWGRAGLLGVLVWFTWRFARVPLGQAAMDSVLHLPNLVFHEAGHVLFSPFGRFMTVLGGSLLQVLVPLILAGAFVRQRELFGAAVCTWWAGQSMLDVAPYIADARALSLVLLGGRTGAEVEGHDWEFLLVSLDMVHRDRTIGLWTHSIGVVVMVASIVLAGAILARGHKGLETPVP